MDDDQRQDLICRLFALLTMKLEDGAALATEGQGSNVALARQINLANRLHTAGSEIATLADAVVAIAGISPP